MPGFSGPVLFPASKSTGFSTCPFSGVRSCAFVVPFLLQVRQNGLRTCCPFLPGLQAFFFSRPVLSSMIVRASPRPFFGRLYLIPRSIQTFFPCSSFTSSLLTWVLPGGASSYLHTDGFLNEGYTDYLGEVVITVINSSIIVQTELPLGSPSSSSLALPFAPSCFAGGNGMSFWQQTFPFMDGK